MNFIYHTALTVRDLKTSRHFYETLFGLKFAFQGERPELGLRFVMLEDERGNKLELMEFRESKAIDPEAEDLKKIGLKHVAFAVEDIEGVYGQALRLGSKVIWPIKKGVTVKRIAFITDPDGMPVELAEL